MDGHRFDRLARRLARGLSRRRLVAGGLAASVFSGVASRHRARPAAAQATRRAICIPFVAPGSGCCRVWCDWVCPCDSVRVAGIAGAGPVRHAAGVAHFTLFASIISEPQVADPATDEVALARLQWHDPDAAVTFDSLHADYYGPLAGVEGGREVLGWTRVNGDGQYPFLLQAVAAEPRGVGPETIRLLVGDAMLDDPAAVEVGLETTGFRYAAEGELMGGDLQLLSFNQGRPSGEAG